MSDMVTNERTRSREQANAHTCKTLLNCYIRELGKEQLSGIKMNPGEKTYAVSFPKSGAAISGKLHYYSASGEHEYGEFRTNDGTELHYHSLARWIVRELQHRYPLITGEREVDFAEKVDNSYRKVALFLERSAGHPVSDYLSSEQSLLYGHPFHPFPKNTLGFTEEEAIRFSPELRASYQLCYMAVRKDVYWEEWVSGSKRAELHESVERQARGILREKRDEYHVLPVHPWQYEYVQNIQAVKDYIQQEKMILLGNCGPMAYPTSSVRTVFMPDMACNIKLPLNIQITNLKRNNSREQMRRTLDAANYLLRRNCFGNEEAARIAYEEGVCGCRFEDEDVTKLLTIAYRPIEFDVASTFVLSSLIEAPVQGEPCRLFSLIDRRIPIVHWFRRYLEISLLPIVRAAEEHGIHFEAHLQNTLLTIKNGMPHMFIIRDLEGVSVNREKGAAAEDGAGPLFYEKEQCWARTDYYFVVNHLGSLIHAIARDIEAEEEHFWAIVRDMLAKEYEVAENEYVLHLLTVSAFYAKKNLVSCLAGNSETPSYAPVDNAMRKIGSEANGTNKLLV